MKVSVFTPSNNPRWLDDAYDSLCAQTHTVWEWIILFNGGVIWEKPNAKMVFDRRVIMRKTETTGNVGALKAEAVALCTGDLLVELDHDDTLTPDALAMLVTTHRLHPDAGLYWSDTLHTNNDGDVTCPQYSEGNGWDYMTETNARYPLGMDTTPHNVSLIWFAPNHVRAFTRAAYQAVGGYRALPVLDDQDLMARLYQYGPFQKSGGFPLYRQRMHDSNTQFDPTTNANIQTGTWDLYHQHFEPNALAWSKRAGLRCLDLGGAHNSPDGYEAVDQHPGPGVTHVHTFPAPMDLPDSSVGVIRAHDFLEHVTDKVTMMDEIWRLLVPGGVLFTNTPSTDGRGAFQDPTHTAFWNANSFWYLTDPAFQRFVPQQKAKFQVSMIRDWYPSLWHEQHRIVYTQANLLCVKPGMPRNGGPLLWPEEDWR